MHPGEVTLDLGRIGLAVQASLAVQQLASAIGVAAIGTVFFSTLSRSGFTAAISRSLEIELGVAGVLVLLAFALPRRPRDPEVPVTEPAPETAPASETPAASETAAAAVTEVTVAASSAA